MPIGTIIAVGRTQHGEAFIRRRHQPQMIEIVSAKDQPNPVKLAFEALMDGLKRETVKQSMLHDRDYRQVCIEIASKPIELRV